MRRHTSTRLEDIEASTESARPWCAYTPVCVSIGLAAAVCLCSWSVAPLLTLAMHRRMAPPL